MSAIQDQIDPNSAAATAEGRLFEAILQSQCFQRSPKLRTLLVYLWEHKDDEVSEYAIAVDALERGNDFDSKIDATVRVQIGRLRKLLTKYYEEEGTGLTSRLTIPLGTHRIEWRTATSGKEYREDRETFADSDIEARVSPFRLGGYRQHLLWTVAVVILMLVSCVSGLTIALVRRNALARRNEGDLANGNQRLSWFWRNLLGNGRTTRIVLPSPVFFTWVRSGDSRGLMARDISVNDSVDLRNSSSLAGLERQFGEPTSWQNYTGASDAVAALRLVQYFSRYGVQSTASTSVESPHQITNYENIIAFGSASDLTTYKSDLDRLSYQLGPTELYVIDKQQSGHPHEFAQTSEAGSRVVVPGLIAVMPHRSTGSWLMLVQGGQTAALISYLVSDDGIKEIEQKQAEYGHTLFFEAIVLSEVNGGHPIQSRLVGFRPLVESEHPSGSGIVAASAAAPKTAAP